MAELQFPDIAGQYQQGYDRGQLQQLNQLAGQAFNAAPGAQRNQLLGQAAAIDPRTALGLQSAFGQQDAAQQEAALNQQKAQQAQQEQQQKALLNMSRVITSIPEAQRDGIYQRMLPSLQAMGMQNLPPNYTPEVGQTAQALISAYDPQKPMNLAAGGAVYDPNTRQTVASNPRGETGELALIHAAQTDPTVMATYQAMHPRAAGSGGAGGGAGAGGFATLNPDEVAGLGLPAGTVIQRDPRGKLSVINKPAQLSATQQAIQSTKAQKAVQAQQDAVSQLDQNIARVDQILKTPAFDNLGTFGGDLMAKIPHTGTADAKAALDSIGYNSLLSTLTNLKSNSPTGASGFGALSDSEGRLLRNAAANLDTAQSNEQLRANLQAYRAQLQSSRQRIANAQISFPGDNGQAQAPAAQQQGSQAAPADFSHLWGG